MRAGLRFRSYMSPSMAVWWICFIVLLIKLLLTDGPRIDIGGVNSAKLINEKRGVEPQMGQLPLH